MALSQYTIAEVRSGGTSTGAAFFDPGQTAGMFTDGAATVADTAAPVFSSASYNFVAGDVGAWVYIGAGTNWTKGWYKIASVASNVATLTATIGQAVKLTTTGTIRPDGPSTVIGCATTASPTGATWSIDYSQQDAVRFTYTDLASAGAGLTVSSAAQPFAKQHVGNGLNITSGTNFTAGRYVIASVAAAVATVVGPNNITTGVGSAGNGKLGGALNAPITLDGKLVGGTIIFISGTFSRTTNSDYFTAINGSVTLPIKFSGYSNVRGDGFLGRSISTGFLITTNFATLNYTAGHFRTDGAFNIVENLYVTQNGNIANGALSIIGVTSMIRNCSVLIIANSIATYALNLYNYVLAVNCDAINQSSTSGSVGIGSTLQNTMINCYAKTTASTSGMCFLVTSYSNTLVGCVASGGSGCGIKWTGSAYNLQITNCTITGNTTDGILSDSTSKTASIINESIVSNNGGYGVNFGGSSSLMTVLNTRMVDNVSGDFNGNLFGIDTEKYNIISSDSGGPEQDFTSYGSANPLGYALVPTSPAYGAGTFGANIGALPKGAGPNGACFPPGLTRGNRRKKLGQ